MSDDDEAEAVLASALSFLDEFYASSPLEDSLTSCPGVALTPDDSPTRVNAQSSGGERRRAAQPQRKRDTNRARALARRELLALRTRVSVLESELSALVSRRQRADGVRRAKTEAMSAAAQVWKDIAASQLDQRARSSCENLRLRALVSSKRKVLLELRKYLIGRVIAEATREFCGASTDVRLPVFNMTVVRVMQELSSRADATYSQVDALFGALGSRRAIEYGDPEPRPVVNRAQRKLVACHSLPFEAKLTGIMTWHHLSRVIRPYATSLFSYRDESKHAISTVTEYFGMKLSHGPTSAEFRVTQTMRRYVQPDRQVIVYESVLDPTAFNGEGVHVGSFRERGVVRISPHRQSQQAQTPMSTLEVFYSVAPPQGAAEQVDIDSLAEFVLQSMMSVTTTNFSKIENLLLGDAARRSRAQRSGVGE